jgi:ABC-2 type transport system permease protein
VTAMLAALDSERIKLSTIRSPWWSAAVAAVLSLGVAALEGSSAYGAAGLPPEKAVVGVAVFGVPVLMVLSAMTMTIYLSKQVDGYGGGGGI